MCRDLVPIQESLSPVARWATTAFAIHTCKNTGVLTIAHCTHIAKGGHITKERPLMTITYCSVMDVCTHEAHC